MSSEQAMLVVFVAATVAPLIGGLVFGPRVPPVVIEIVVGILIGPHVFDLAERTSVVDYVATLGLSFLFFMAGMEIDFAQVDGQPLTLGAVTWFTSIAVGLTMGTLLQGTGVVLSSLLVGVAFTTTALGTLMPILRDNKELDTRFGTLVVGAGTVGEFGPIVLVSTLLSSHSSAASFGAILTFLALAMVIAVTALKLHPPNLMRVIGRSMHTSAQLPVRLAVCLIIAFVFLTAHIGLDAVLGAFAAGVIVSLVAGRDRAELDGKLEAIAYGVFIPVFFVTTGLSFDLPSLASSQALWRLPLFVCMFLLVRGAPALLVYRRALPSLADRIDLALFTSTQLPLVVAIATIGLATHRMHPYTASALIGAGMTSVLIFPMLAEARRIRRRGLPHAPTSAPETASAVYLSDPVTALPRH
jgi:Kef-type K+ transport system membrane component KefB